MPVLQLQLVLFSEGRSNGIINDIVLFQNSYNIWQPLYEDALTSLLFGIN